MENKRIVFFARDGELSNNTVSYLLRNDVKPKLIIIERRNKKAEIRTYINTQGVFRLFLFLLRSYTKKLVGRKGTPIETPEQICNKYAIPYIIVKSHNGKKSLKVLNELGPDLGVICAARILSKKVISIFKIGIINCHPGWLPDYRGWDALRWSVLRNKNIGITTHFVDEKVDAGPIIMRKALHSENFSTFTRLYQEALVNRQTMLAESIKTVCDKNFEATPQAKEEGKRYYRMNYIQMLIVNLKLYRNNKKKSIA